MIEITLSELDLGLEVAEFDEFEASIDETSNDIGLQGPIRYDFDAMPLEIGYLDLDLLGFPYHGLSAYELAIKNGFIGSLAQWLASLKGEPGDLSPAGQDGVARAEAAAASASGDATAAAGFRSEAYTYSGYAGVHAQAANEAYTNAVAARDETGQIAQGMTLIRQESEAMIIGARELATATIQERVKAETARASAEASETQTALSESSAEASAASASNSASLAVNAQTAAGQSAEAALLAESSAAGYADDAKSEADAARLSEIRATAARDEANVTATGVVTQVQTAKAYADDARTQAEAAVQSKLGAQAAFGDAKNSASAAFTSAQTADARASDAASSASAASTQRQNAQTAASNASGYATQAFNAYQDANGAKAAAEEARRLAVEARGQAGQSASAALSESQRASAFADTAGNIYGALAQRTTTTEGRVQDAEGKITSVEEVAIEARDQIRLSVRVRLDNNGYVSGWETENNGRSGSFTVIGDQFFLVNPNNGDPFRPFIVDGNKATFNSNVEINGNLVVNGTISTPKIQDNSVTRADSMRMGSPQVGTGGKVNVINYNINLPYAAKLIMIAVGTHNYTASGAPAFEFDISVDGISYDNIGGANERQFGMVVASYAFLGAGQHTISVGWLGATNGFRLERANLIVITSFK